MKRILLTALILPVAAALLWSQQDPVAVLEFYDDEAGLQILDSQDFDVSFYIGMGLTPGDQIITTDSSAEIRLEPNGSILRVAPDTRFVVEGLQGGDTSDRTAFALERGRFRLVAARFLDRDTRYQVRTPTAVAGVRGTDFGMTVVRATETAPASEELFVFTGEVVLESGRTGEEIAVAAGQRAEIFSDTFAPLPMGDREILSRRNELEFVQLDPDSVPRISEAPPQENQEDEAAGEEEDSAVVDVPTESVPEAQTREAEEGLGDRMFGRLAQITGLQVGSVTINQETWAQAVFQPRISLGRLTLELYLPLTYQNDLFDAGEWYRPEGNNEWSFGADQDWSDDPVAALRDVATDAALKIKALEYGTRGDGLYLQVGNVSSFTIGQGLLMRNYANDIDFPAVRRVGFNLGLDFSRWGLETVVNDLAAPEIYAGRLYFRPAAPVTPAAVGISAVTDLAPGSGITTVGRDGTPISPAAAIPLNAADSADPLFLNVAMDLEVPILTGDRLSLVGFAEGGGLIPYLRNDTVLGSESVGSGLKTEALVDFSSGELKNFGWTVGARGNATVIDYRLEFRSYDGIFRPGFYGPTYDRLRAQRAAETVAYLSDTEAEEYQVRTLGIAGEAGTSLFGLVDLRAGYFWPWEITEGGDWQGSDDDELLFSLILQEGLIPFGIETGFEYRRTHFAATVATWGRYEDATLFDANTSLDAYVAYPFNEFVRLVARVSTTTVRNDEGEIVYDNNGNAKMAPTVAIQTQIGF